MKLLKLFRCFTIQTEEEPEFKYETGLDGQNVYEKDCLYFLLSMKINYKAPRPKIINNIEDIRDLFYKEFDIIPIPFQQTYNVISPEKLHKIVYEQLHNTNIKKILDVLVKDYENKKKSDKKMTKDMILEHFEKSSEEDSEVEEI